MSKEEIETDPDFLTLGTNYGDIKLITDGRVILTLESMLVILLNFNNKDTRPLIDWLYKHRNKNDQKR